MANVKGNAKKVDVKGGKITLVHALLLNLEMPVMTLLFRADEVRISNMSTGQDIAFFAAPARGELTVAKRI